MPSRTKANRALQGMRQAQLQPETETEETFPVLLLTFDEPAGEHIEEPLPAANVHNENVECDLLLADEKSEGGEPEVRRSYLFFALGLTGAAVLLNIASLILAALEVRDSVIYSHNYDGGSIPEGLVQFFEILTLVESIISLITLTACFSLLTQQPSAVLTHNARSSFFTCLCAVIVLLFALAVYSTVTQALSAYWDQDLPHFYILSVFSFLRAVDLGAFFVVCVMHAKVPFADSLIYYFESKSLSSSPVSP